MFGIFRKLNTKLDTINKESEQQVKEHRETVDLYLVKARMAKSHEEFVQMVDKAIEEAHEMTKEAEIRRGKVLKELEDFNHQLTETIG